MLLLKYCVSPNTQLTILNVREACCTLSINTEWLDCAVTKSRVSTAQVADGVLRMRRQPDSTLCRARQAEPRRAQLLCLWNQLNDYLSLRLSWCRLAPAMAVLCPLLPSQCLLRLCSPYSSTNWE